MMPDQVVTGSNLDRDSLVYRVIHLSNINTFFGFYFRLTDSLIYEKIFNWWIHEL